MVTRKEIEKYKKYILKHDKKYDSPKYDDPSMVDPKDALKYSKAIDVLAKNRNDLIDYLKKKVGNVKIFSNPKLKDIYGKIVDHNIISEEEVDKALGSESKSISLEDIARDKFKGIKPKMLNRILKMIEDGTFKSEKDLDEIEIVKAKNLKKQPEPKSESDKEEEVVPIKKKVGRPRKNPISTEPKEKKPRGRASTKPKEEPKPTKVLRAKGRPKKVISEEEKEKKEKELELKKKKKEEKLKKNLKPYYKIGVVPPYHRRATMAEAVKNKKVFYWGINKVDPKLIAGESSMKLKDLEKKRGDIMVKKAGMVALYNKLKKELEQAKAKGTPTKEIIDKLTDQQKLLKEVSDEFNYLNSEIEKLNKD